MGDASEGGLQEAPAEYGPDFGMRHDSMPSWVPEKSGSLADGVETSAPGAVEGPPATGMTTRVSAGASPSGVGALDGSQPSQRRGTRRVQPWQVVAVVAGSLLPLVLWVVSNVGAPPDPLGAGPADRAGPLVVPPRTTTSVPVSTPPATSVTAAAPVSPQPGRSQPSRLPMPSPPALLPGSSMAVTPVPATATVIRFEAYAEGDAVIDVSLSDATHQRQVYPRQHPPVALEVPVPTAAASSDYFSLRARIPASSGAALADVSCRILVDGIVVTSQQGQGYATCYISPYYDIRRT